MKYIYNPPKSPLESYALPISLETLVRPTPNLTHPQLLQGSRVNLLSLEKKEAEGGEGGKCGKGHKCGKCGKRRTQKI